MPKLTDYAAAQPVLHSHLFSAAWNGPRREGEHKRMEGGREKGKRRKRERASHLPRLSVDVEHVTLLNVELEETARNLRNPRLELEVGDVLVVGQVKVSPYLGLLDFLTPNDLCNLLLLLNGVDYVTITISLAFSMYTASVEKNVMDGVDAIHWASDDSVLCLFQTADTGLALWCRRTNLDRSLPPGVAGSETIGIAAGHVDKK